jgi:hypothetical protein
MLILKKMPLAALCCATGLLSLVTAAGWAVTEPIQDREPPPQRDGEGEEAGRRRVVRIVLPYSELEDLSPKQQETIREIRREIMIKREDLDREERERIMAVLTDSQKARVAEIEAERAAREREQRERDRQDGEQQRQGQGGDGGDL